MSLMTMVSLLARWQLECIHLCFSSLLLGSLHCVWEACISLKAWRIWVCKETSCATINYQDRNVFIFTIQFYSLPVQDDASRLVETKKVKSGPDGPSAAMMNQHDIQSKRVILGDDSFDCDLSAALTFVSSSPDQGTQAVVSKGKGKAASSAKAASTDEGRRILSLKS